jgi:hypothetical protein
MLDAVLLLSDPWLPDFSWHNIPKRGKIHQITIKYVYKISTKCVYQMAVCNIDQMAIKYTNILNCKPSKTLGFFGLKRYHLATLCQIRGGNYREWK